MDKATHTRIGRHLSRLGRLTLPAAVALAFTVIAMTAARAESLYNAVSATLPNGLEVVVVADHRAPVVTHMVWYKVGAADEPPGKSGIAHFLEHLMFKGTREYPEGMFSKLVARHGGRENAFTAHDYTAYFQTIAREHLELVMRLEADRMRNLVLTAEAVVSERDVVLEERRQRTGNSPGALFGEQLAAAQFLAHPYGIPVIGWEHEISGLALDDAVGFYDRYYAPNNAILVVVGDVTMAEVRPLAEGVYGAIARRDVPLRQRSQEPAQIAARRLEYSDDRVREPSWRRSYLAPSYVAGAAERAYALVVLADILGGGPTSRMYRALVVDAKIAADAGAYYSAVSLDPSRFYLYAAPLAGHDLETVEEAVDAVIQRVIADGVTEDELNLAKGSLTASAIYARDRLSSAARIFGSSLAVGLTIADVEAWPGRIEAVSVADIKAAARHVFDAGRSVTGLLRPKPAS